MQIRCDHVAQCYSNSVTQKALESANEGETVVQTCKYMAIFLLTFWHKLMIICPVAWAQKQSAVTM